MKLSKDRILTTHVGSLPRSEKVFKLVFAKEDGKNLDKKEYDEVIADAVKTVVKKQEEVGIDVVSDGEQSKISYATYIKDRLNGFEGDSPRLTPKDLEEFPTFSSRASIKALLQGTISLLRTSLFPIVSSVFIDDSKILLFFGEENSFKNLSSGLCWVFLLIISHLAGKILPKLF